MSRAEDVQPFWHIPPASDGLCSLTYTARASTSPDGLIHCPHCSAQYGQWVAVRCAAASTPQTRAGAAPPGTAACTGRRYTAHVTPMHAR